MQIQSSTQYAASVVRQYPRTFDINLQLESLARQHSEPSPSELMRPSGLDDLQHAADWEIVVQYLVSMDPDGLHDHRALLQHPC